MNRFAHALVIAGLSLAAAGSLRAQDKSFTVTLVPPVHGKVQLTPPLPADGKYTAGTVVTVTTTPDSGYVLDSAWYSVAGRFGQMYHEGMTRDFKVTIDQDKRIGASFIEASDVKDLVVTNDIVYAKPGVKPLKYDVFAPKGARSLPIIVIIHGGGWTANDEDIMRGLARELTKGGKFVVFSMDYRWAGKADGDPTGNRTGGAAVPDPRHERSVDYRRGREGIRRRPGQAGTTRGIHSGGRREPRVFRLEARRDHQGDLRQIRRVLR